MYLYMYIYISLYINIYVYTYTQPRARPGCDVVRLGRPTSRPVSRHPPYPSTYLYMFGLSCTLRLQQLCTFTGICTGCVAFPEPERL